VNKVKIKTTSIQTGLFAIFYAETRLGPEVWRLDTTFKRVYRTKGSAASACGGTTRVPVAVRDSFSFKRQVQRVSKQFALDHHLQLPT